MTIGVFDGVHLGHRHLVGQAVRRARERGCLCGAVTFHPHPRAVVAGHSLAYLCTLDERLDLLRGLGLDVVVALPFTQDLARLTAFEFMSLLCRSVRLRELWVGSDFALGHRREGTVSRLAEIGRELGYEVREVPPLVVQGQNVSSSLIRELIGQGQVEEAARLLARWHRVCGTAVPGDHRARRPGLPATTVIVSDGLAVPASGVYAARMRCGDRQWTARVHVEPDPAGTMRRLEVSAPDLPGDLVGQTLQVEFVRRLGAGAPADAMRTPVEMALAQRGALSPA